MTLAQSSKKKGVVEESKKGQNGHREAQNKSGRHCMVTLQQEGGWAEHAT